MEEGVEYSIEGFFTLTTCDSQPAGQLLSPSVSHFSLSRGTIGMEEKNKRITLYITLLILSGGELYIIDPVKRSTVTPRSLSPVFVLVSTPLQVSPIFPIISGAFIPVLCSQLVLSRQAYQ